MYIEPDTVSSLSFWLVLAAGLVAWIALLIAVVALTRTRREVRYLRKQRSILHGAAVEARQTFTRYGVLHRAKKTPEGESKAMANERLASAMDRALRRTEYLELSPMQEALSGLRAKLEAAGFPTNG